MVRASSGNYTNRTITGTSNEIIVTNGDGVSGNPTLELPSAVYLGSSGKIGSDADNLFDFSTDNQITFRTNATDQMILDASGRLGIGTSTMSNALTVISSGGAQLRLGYNADNFVEFNVDSSGRLAISSATTTIGVGSETMRIVDGRVGIGTSSPLTSLSIQGTTGTDLLNIASSTGDSMFYINESGYVGIGTVDPGAAKLYVDGATTLNGNLNVTGASASNIVGSLDVAGKGAFGASASVSGNATLNVARTVTGTSGSEYNSVGTLYLNPSADTTGAYWGNVISTEVKTGNTKNFSTNGMMGTLSAVRHRGTGNIWQAYGLYGLTKNYSTGSITDAIGTYGIVQNTDAGIITNAYGLLSQIIVDGSGTTTNAFGGYITTPYASPGGIYNNYGLYIENQNIGIDNNYAIYSAGGKSYFAGNVGIGTSSPYSKLTVWGSGTTTGQLLSLVDSASTSRMVVLENGNVGIGTSSPSAKLNILDTAAGNTDDILVVSTSSDGKIFRVTGAGDVYADGSFIDTGADYAEYFWTADTDLESGEVVCVDVAHDNAVKRCERGADGNVMGIVSTRPAIVGNAKPGYTEDEHYKIIGMLGQVLANVSTENGEIRPGDSLTSASSTPGYAMRALPGDPTVGIALEPLRPPATSPYQGEENGAGSASGTSPYQGEENGEIVYGEINVLISRRNKSLTVEMVEAKVTERIAAMEIEDEVQILLAQAIEDYNLASSVEAVVDEQINEFDSRLTVEFDAVSEQLTTLAVSVDDVIARMNVVENNIMDIDSRLTAIEAWQESGLAGTGTTSSTSVIVVTEEGNIKMGAVKVEEGTSTPDVAIVEIVTATTTDKTAFVVNQVGEGDVADFRADGVSIVNIADSGQVSVVGEMLVDGRLMVCAGGACGSSLDEAVDETMGDMGVEGKVVAGAFEGYCDNGFVWVPGSAKYGTLPGFCVMSGEARYADSDGDGLASIREIVNTDKAIWTDVSQGEAKLACQSLGDGYHLVSENEWMTMAENIIRVVANDIDEEEDGLQLATDPSALSGTSPWQGEEDGASSSVAFVLSNDYIVYELVGGVSEWTDQMVTQAGVLKPVMNAWQEYYEITDYQGFNIAPPYYYNSANNIGRVFTGDNDNALRGFVRGAAALFDLNLSYSPIEATSTIGFRCAR